MAHCVSVVSREWSSTKQWTSAAEIALLTCVVYIGSAVSRRFSSRKITAPSSLCCILDLHTGRGGSRPQVRRLLDSQYPRPYAFHPRCEVHPFSYSNHQL